MKPPMAMRSIRVPLRLWNEAKVRADEREENLSDVLREALERYVMTHGLDASGISEALPTGDDMTTGPDEDDVKKLTEMLDLLEHFPSNEQRARYLLTSNWFAGEGVDVAIRARVNAAEFWRRRP